MKNMQAEDPIATLKRVRDRSNDRLDDSVLAEFDDALNLLEQGNLPSGELASRELAVMEWILRLMTNLTDLMK